MPDIKLGSLFDGIGVFSLAASRCGIRPVWASEIEKAPISITKRHFPDMVHLGDITKVDGGKIPPPGFTLVHLLSIAFHETIISLNQVENQTEQGGLARTIITYEPYQLTLCNTQIINIEYGIAIIYLFEILNLDIHYSNV